MVSVSEVGCLGSMILGIRSIHLCNVLRKYASQFALSIGICRYNVG